MKKILIAVVVIAILGGGGAYLLTKDDNNKQAQTNTETQTNTQTGSNNFSPLSTEGLDFVSTITTTTKAGTSTAKFERDGKKTRYTITANGTTSQFINADDAFYTCSDDGQCTKYPQSQSNSSGVDVKSFEYTGAELANFKNTAAYKGKQDCPAGSCDVWSVSYAGVSSTIYIDSQTQRISQVEGNIGGNTTKITYEYRDVSIKIPANAKTFPTTP